MTSEHPNLKGMPNGVSRSSFTVRSAPRTQADSCVSDQYRLSRLRLDDEPLGSRASVDENRA